MSGAIDSSDNPRKRRGKPFIGMLFKCCHVYSRLYLNPDGTAYAGLCPKCGARVRVRVGADGTDERFFQAV
jgi:hypothetical protein